MKKLKKNLKPKVLVVLALFASSCCNEKNQTTNNPKPHVAVIVAEGFHDAEAYMPIGYLLNQGFEITVIGSESGTVKAYNSDFTITIEKSVKNVNVTDFDGIILPGGKGPALLREDEAVVDFVRKFWETGKITAAICHGPQVLITAGIMSNVTCTGFSGIQEELEAAGANYKDESVVVHKNIITSRIPVDLYNFSKTIAQNILKD